jgi:hypothetical protein
VSDPIAENLAEAIASIVANPTGNVCLIPFPVIFFPEQNPQGKNPNNETHEH